MSSVLALALLLAEPLTAEEILHRADRAVLGENAAYTLRMTVTRPGKTNRVVDMNGWKKGDEKGLVRYTSPPKERGTAYLRSGESTWMFLPSAEKVVRVGTKQNFGGGDFSNGDIFRLSLTRDYNPTLAGEETMEGQSCYKLDLKAKDRSVAYDRVLWASARVPPSSPWRTRWKRGRARSCAS
jgi:outer membrane lipoprotein-sorting protein